MREPRRRAGGCREAFFNLLSACLTDLKVEGKQFGLTAFQDEYFFTAYTDYPDNDWTVGGYAAHVGIFTAHLIHQKDDHQPGYRGHARRSSELYY